MKIESFPISEEAVRDFIKINKWEAIEYLDGAIYLNFSMVRMQAGWIVPKLLYAKGMQEKLRCRVYVLTWDENPLLKELFESYGFEHIALNSLNNKHIGALFKAGFQTLAFMLGKADGVTLQKMEAGGMNVGRLLYEDIIRTSDLSTIRNARTKLCFKKILHILWTVYSLDKMTDSKKPLIFINDDLAYHEGIFVKLFDKKGARVFATNATEERQQYFDNTGRIVRNNEDMCVRFHKDICDVPEDADKWSENFLDERFQGKNGRDIDRGAFTGKKVLSREEVIQEFNLNPEKKNIVIMAHTFTDGIYNYGITPFRDYYDWLDKTLEYAESIDSVNWILKPHPTRGAYNEEKDSIEMMFERHKKAHIHMLGDNVSAESIKNIADVIITIGGNAGGEFACLGVPAVIVGKPYYADFGYTIEPKTLEEYENVLKTANHIERLTDEQIKTARKVFYLRNHKPDNPDEYDYISDKFGKCVNKLYNDMLNAMSLEYFASNKGTDSFNDAMLKGITDFMRENDIKLSAYYRKGYFRA